MYIKGNLINLFYAAEGAEGATDWKYFGYTQNTGLSQSASSNSISSKDHGLHPDKEITEITGQFTNTMYVETTALDVVLKMSNSAKNITWAFAVVKDTSGTSAADGLQPVTNYGTTNKWEIGSWVQYANGKLTSLNITANTGEVASIDITIDLTSALSSSVPTGANLYKYSAS